MKSTIFKIIYIFIVVTICAAMSLELYLVIERRKANEQAETSKIIKNNMFTQIPQKVADDDKAVETLWEVPWEKYKANAKLEGTIGHQKVVVKINSHGFRTHEFETEKPDDVYRIISIGASTTYQGTRNDNTYPALLEKKLRTQYPNVKFEVLNFGISGSRSDYWISRIDKLFQYQPDMIIQYNAVNDITGPYMSRIENTCTGRLKLSVIKAFNISFLYQKLFSLDPSFMDGCFNSTFNNFNHIAREAKERDIHYIIGTFAGPDYSKADTITKYNFDNITQSSWGRGLYLKYYSSYYGLLKRFNSLLIDYARLHDLNTAQIDTNITDPMYFTDICHMNQEGIAIMADTFYEAVVEVLDKKHDAANLTD